MIGDWLFNTLEFSWASCNSILLKDRSNQMLTFHFQQNPKFLSSLFNLQTCCLYISYPKRDLSTITLGSIQVYVNVEYVCVGGMVWAESAQLIKMALPIERTHAVKAYIKLWGSKCDFMGVE